MRSIVLWCPDWSVVAAYRDDSLPEVTTDVPVALMRSGAVAHCCAQAKSAGVRIGMRRRDAHTLCPQLVMAPIDEARDRNAFDRVLIDLADYVPRHSLLAPGLVAFGARGLERFYGSEEAAGRMLLSAVAQSEPLAEGRIGIADDVFTAVTAAQQTTTSYPLRAVAPGQSAVFLADLPVDVLDHDDVISLLLRLGIRTVGDFVSLGEKSIRERWGVLGERLYALATGQTAVSLPTQDAPAHNRERIELPDGCYVSEQVAFNITVRTQEYESRVRESGRVITRVRIRVGMDDGTTSERVWTHPRFFRASDLVDRVRWQLERRVPEVDTSDALAPAVGWVEYEALVPEDVTSHEPGLWGSGPDSRVHHVFSRVQGLVGAQGVLTARSRPGRIASETHSVSAWGDSEDAPLVGPLPGSLPSPLPATVFSSPQPVSLVAEDGSDITVSPRAELSGAPTWLISGPRRLKISSWAGPWPVWEKWWDPARSRFVHRVQIIDENGMGWLMALSEQVWRLEARYD